jgi:acetyl-CoA acetyltransferase
VSLNGALMQAYMDRYGVPHDDFAPFALTAHANAQTSAHAVFKNKPLDFATYANADVIAGPVQVGVVLRTRAFCTAGAVLRAPRATMAH